MKLYLANIQNITAAIVEQNLVLLDSDRQEKVRRLKSEKERHRSFLAGLLLRHAFLCEGYSKEAWNEIHISYNESGKPCILEYPGFSYSISHSGDCIGILVANEACGFDIQEMKQAKLAIAKRFFANEEYELLEKVQENVQEEIFYKLWTGKESFLKWQGTGIYAGLDQCVCHLQEDYIIDGKGNKGYLQYAKLHEYMMCICLQGKQHEPIEMTLVSYEEIL